MRKTMIVSRSTMVVLAAVCLMITAGISRAEEADDFMPSASVSFGAGVHYGGVGANFEFQGIPYASFTAGVGGTEGVPMVVGGFRIILPFNDKFAGRFSVLAGKVAVLEETTRSIMGDSTNKSALSGVAGGIGSTYYTSPTTSSPALIFTM